MDFELWYFFIMVLCMFWYHALRWIGIEVSFIATPRGLCIGIDFLFWRG